MNSVCFDNTMPLVSVIVPIFNTEQFLCRCLDSIITQSYSNLEIILVDDGSTDNSGLICDEYSAKDKRIKVIHQSNMGILPSRKNGIEVSTGEYIQFVDSDDWIERDAVETLLNKAIEEKVDLVWCNVMLHQTTGTSVFKISFDKDSVKMLNSIYLEKVPGWTVNKLFHSKLLQNIVSKDDNMLEDIFLTTQVLIQQPRMEMVDKALYHYDNSNTDSVTNVFHNEIWIKGLPNIIHCYDYIVSCHCIGSYKSSLCYKVLKAKISLINIGEYKKAQSVLPVTHRSIRNYPIAFPYSLVYWIGLNLGVFGRFFFSLYFRFKTLVSR